MQLPQKLIHDDSIVMQATPTTPQAEQYFRDGLAAAQAHNLPLAETLVNKAVACNGAPSGYYQLLCDIQRCLKKLDEAIAAGNRAVQLAAGDAEAHYLLALALSDDGRRADAAEHYRTALQLRPSHDKAANNLGTLLEAEGNLPEAEISYACAVASNPRNAAAQNNLGALLSTRGDLDLARGHFSAAIHADPLFIHAHFNLSTLKTYTADDPHLATMEQLTPQAQYLPADMQIRLWFSLGKAWEDVGRYDDSFAAYERGNRLHRATFFYDENTAARSMQDIIQRFDKSFATQKTAGLADETPIFIVGMPRSGTTLVEQILSSHSAVFGAGELNDLCDSVSQHWQISPGFSYIDRLISASQEELADIGQSYLQKIRALNAAAPHITDKMPGNYFYIGLIHKLFPRAKIIHCMRDPMDTCFSNYSRFFKEAMPFAYDLQELGRYWRQYDALMKHWKQVLPENTILDVRYEDVVADLETQARRLTQHCGLAWEDSCLAFHDNKRLVKTASIAQVRQPIYRTSVARWEHYRSHLEPLRLALEGKDTRLSIEQALLLADHAQAKGQLAEAEHYLKKILAVAPRHIHALHLLGIVAYKAGKPDIAMQLLKQAIAAGDTPKE